MFVCFVYSCLFVFFFLNSMMNMNNTINTLNKTKNTKYKIGNQFVFLFGLFFFFY